MEKSSSPTRDGTQAPCIGSMESYQLDNQGIPLPKVFNLSLNMMKQSDTSRLWTLSKIAGLDI